MQLDGIFILAELKGATADRIREINERFDPKLARYKPPHLSITGSSGVGPLPAATSVEALRKQLEPITSATAPIELSFGKPHRFLQTGIIVLPVNHFGPLRELHDRIAASGLSFGRVRYTFSPHCTLSLYATLSPEAMKEIMKDQPIGRLGRPEEIAAPVVWLCSPGASFVIGHALVVDGGYTVR